MEAIFVSRCQLVRVAMPAEVRCEVLVKLDLKFEISDVKYLVKFGSKTFSTCQESTKKFGANLGANFGKLFGNFVSKFASSFGNFVQQKGGVNNLGGTQPS